MADINPIDGANVPEGARPVTPGSSVPPTPPAPPPAPMPKPVPAPIPTPHAAPAAASPAPMPKPVPAPAPIPPSHEAPKAQVLDVEDILKGGKKSKAPKVPKGKKGGGFWGGLLGGVIAVVLIGGALVASGTITVDDILGTSTSPTAELQVQIIDLEEDLATVNERIDALDEWKEGLEEAREEEAKIEEEQSEKIEGMEESFEELQDQVDENSLRLELRSSASFVPREIVEEAQLEEEELPIVISPPPTPVVPEATGEQVAEETFPELPVEGTEETEENTELEIDNSAL